MAVARIHAGSASGRMAAGSEASSPAADREGRAVSTIRGLAHVRETDIVRSIRGYLELRGFRIFRRNVGGAYAMRLGREQFVRFSEPGAADLTGWEIGTGRAIEVEVKVPGARTDPRRHALQQAWLEQAKRDGLIAFRASSVQECEARLEEYGYARRLLL